MCAVLDLVVILLLWGRIVSEQVVSVGGYKAGVNSVLAGMDASGFVRRFWEKDASLWSDDPDVQKAVVNRLGWLGVVPVMLERAGEIEEFVEGIKAAGFTHAVLMGMGGSSLSPEVSRLTFGVKSGHPDLMVLDSTVPGAVLSVQKKIDPANTLFIVATKSGSTIETISAYKYFYEKVRGVKTDAGENFIAITDPGSSLVDIAEKDGFRKVFLNFADIGGRYSALSYFGLVPAALIGVDIRLLLTRAAAMIGMCAPSVKASENPAVSLGAVMAALAKEGRDKLTLVFSPEIKSFGYWVEQLVAESTGKNGAGILPVEGEPVLEPEYYGRDRLFVYMKVKDGSLDERMNAIEMSGHPMIKIELDDVYDMGGEYFKWEMATGTASALLGVNAYDEPNVTESKKNTCALIDEFKATGSLPEEFLDSIEELPAFLEALKPGDYIALMAFIHGDSETEDLLSSIRGEMMMRYNAAVTLGYGPRFLHSTGQFHKGGPDSGIFIQLTADDPEDADIPGEKYGFKVLKDAQAMGDEAALKTRSRRFVRLHLGLDVGGGLDKILAAIGRLP